MQKQRHNHEQQTFAKLSAASWALAAAMEA